MEKTKKVVELAEKELQEEEEQKQIDLVKKAIKKTLEAIKVKEEKRTKLNKEIKTLKQDMDNIRAGRLDLIAERQEKDDEAKKTSIIEVIKEVHHHHYDWYTPYRIIINEPYYKYPNSGYWTTYCGSSTADLTCYNTTTLTNSDNLDVTAADYINCSIAKDSYAGTYQLDDGACVTLT